MKSRRGASLSGSCGNRSKRRRPAALEGSPLWRSAHSRVWEFLVPILGPDWGGEISRVPCAQRSSDVLFGEHRCSILRTGLPVPLSNQIKGATPGTQRLCSMHSGILPGETSSKLIVRRSGSGSNQAAHPDRLEPTSTRTLTQKFEWRDVCPPDQC